MHAYVDVLCMHAYVHVLSSFAWLFSSLDFVPF